VLHVTLPNDSNERISAMPRVHAPIFDEMADIERWLKDRNYKIEAIVALSDTVSRLMIIPGIGLLATTALLTATENGHQFRKTRDPAVWPGLVPREYSAGDKTPLLGISRPGFKYLRRLSVHNHFV